MSEKAIVPVEAKRQANEEGETASMWLDVVKTFSVIDDVSYATAAEECKAIKIRCNTIDAKRKEWVGPLTNVVRSINAFFATPIKNLEAAEKHLKGEMGRYDVRQREQAVEAMQASAAAYAAGQAPTAVIPAPPVAQGVTTVMIRKFRVTDSEAVSRQFCSPDPAKIQAYLDNGGIEAIKGIEFYDDPQVRISVK